MTILPAPYESAPDDDLGAATSATLAATLGALVAVSLGSQAWEQGEQAATAFIEAPDQFLEAQLPTAVTTVGWGGAAVFMGLGALLLLFRLGRGALIFGSALSLGTTFLARYGFEWFTPTDPLEHYPVFLGGIPVLLLALLPTTGRWIAGRRSRRMRSGAGTFATPTSATPPRPISARVHPAG